MSNKTEAKQTINKAFKAFDKTFDKPIDKIGATFNVDGKEVGIPQSFIDLVMALNPKDSKKQEAITKELFKDKK